MMFDWLAMLAFAGYVAFGATIRTMLGIYKAYDTFPELHVEWKRIVFEIVMSVMFGTFGVFVLNELHVFNFGLTIAAVIAGLLGPDTIKLITKKFGVTRATEAIVSRQQMKFADLNERQVRAMDYLQQEGKITNKVYQKINSVNRDVAKYELNSLMRKGRLIKQGYNKNSRYALAGQGKKRAISGVTRKTARKIHHKLPGRNSVAVKPGFEAQRRVFPNSRLRDNN